MFVLSLHCKHVYLDFFPNFEHVFAYCFIFSLKLYIIIPPQMPEQKINYIDVDDECMEDILNLHLM